PGGSQGRAGCPGRSPECRCPPPAARQRAQEQARYGRLTPRQLAPPSSHTLLYPIRRHALRLARGARCRPRHPGARVVLRLRARLGLCPKSPALAAARARGRRGLCRYGLCLLRRLSQLRTRPPGEVPLAANAWLAPGSRRANDMSIPSPTIVTSTDDRPLDTRGSGTPVIGVAPMTAPMLITAWPTIQAVIAADSRRLNVSGARRATLRPAKARPPYSAVTHNVPTRPSSSPMIAKMKSLVDSGSQPHFSRLAPRPTPKMPPEPSAYLPCVDCQSLV